MFGVFSLGIHISFSPCVHIAFRMFSLHSHTNVTMCSHSVRVFSLCIHIPLSPCVHTVFRVFSLCIHIPLSPCVHTVFRVFSLCIHTQFYAHNQSYTICSTAWVQKPATQTVDTFILQRASFAFQWPSVSLHQSAFTLQQPQRSLQQPSNALRTGPAQRPRISHTLTLTLAHNILHTLTLSMLLASSPTMWKPQAIFRWTLNIIIN